MLGSRLKGFLPTILLSTLLMGSSFPSAAVLLVSGADALSLVSMRFLIASLVAWAMVGLLRNTGEPLVPWRVAALIGFFQTFGVMAPVHVALGSEAPPVVASIVFSNVLMVAGYEMFIGRRQASRALVFALALGFVGLILVTNLLTMPVSYDVQASHSGVLLSLMAALSWTFATLLSKKQEIAGGWRFNAQQMLVGTMFLGAFTLAWNGPTLWIPQASVDALWLLWLSIPASVVSFGLWFRALSQRTATEASAWLAAVPAFSALIAWVILGADFTPLQSIGMMLIAIALFLQSKTPSPAQASLDSN
jgi:drug/metabolite transporter (DMT)-like permease